VTSIFADAAFYVAAFNPDDAFHAAARRFSDTYNGAVVTSEFVLLEVGNFFSRPRDRALFCQFMADIRADRQTTIIGCSREWFDRGFNLFQARLDKEWSLVDCISMEIMSRRKLRRILTTDHHFEQAGFEVLLK
jgi:predicted nucleic acid-binding protein